ncbi:MAG TPA: hypothetical protein VH088_07255 [Terriglobales bacterium]|jgi:hypothetical protein|nr:hypothetical protein [Terriglobales bacterium]
MTTEQNVALEKSDVNEDQTLALLRQPAATSAVLEKIAKDPATAKSRKIKLALIEHLHTPRHVSLLLLRNLYTFDLMTVALMPVVAADIKIAAEESLIQRLEKLSIGEKLSLARRASTRVVAALLHQSDARIVNAALETPRLTEIVLVNALASRDSSDLLDQTVRRHAKWSLRPEIQQALQRRADRTPEDA